MGNNWLLLIFNWIYLWIVILSDTSLTKTFSYDRTEFFPRDFIFNISMPDIRPSEPEAYICTAVKLSSQEQYIVNFEPHVDSKRSHHMLLFGCGSLYRKSQLYPRFWDCRFVDLCRKMSIMYGWAKNAPPVSLPPDVGFRISGNSSIRYLVLQVHYANPLPDGVVDDSGLSLHVTTKIQRNIAGIYVLSSSGAVIPPHNPKVHVDVNCRLQLREPLHLFAYRVHSHKLGTVIAGYKYTFENDSWTLLAKGNPQLPQAFYPMDHIYTIRNNEALAARCTYDSSHVDTETHIGSTTNDEMCNLYLMYYTRTERGQTFYRCTDARLRDLNNHLPEGSDVLPPVNPFLEDYSHFFTTGEHPISYNKPWTQNTANIAVDKKGLPLTVTPQHLQFGNKLEPYNYHSNQWDDAPNPTFNSNFKYNVVDGWPAGKRDFGQITGVSIDKQGNVIFFHRGNHVWNALSFDLQERYLPTNRGPISVPTVITLDSATGHIIHEWGSNLFFLPHGLTVGPDNFLWLTDVALHQVFKFSSKGSTQPVMSLGTRFIPGNDDKHFCKPTSVAISSNGDIYVADGYCNSRIVRFSAEGQYLSQWGKANIIGEPNSPPGALSVPHKVVVAEDKNLICVADRENGRIQCFTLVTGYFHFEIVRSEFGGKLFSIDYSPKKGGLLYAVCGESLNPEHIIQAFVFNFTTHELLNTFVPKDGTFTRPHDLAVSRDTSDAYVVEIGPNNIWKFSLDHHKSTKKVLKGSPVTNSSSHNSSLPHDKKNSTVVEASHKNLTQHSKEIKKKLYNIDGEVNNFGTSMIIMALLGLPVLILILVTVIIRLKKRGKLHNCSLGHFKGWLGGYRTPGPQEKFNLGTLLNPHKGFDRVALEESDVDGEEGSDSDIEEFNAATRKA